MCIKNSTILFLNGHELISRQINQSNGKMKTYNAQVPLTNAAICWKAQTSMQIQTIQGYKITWCLTIIEYGHDIHKLYTPKQDWYSH